MEVSSHSILQGIFPTQGLNPSLLHCRKTLNHLSHQGRPYSPDLSPTDYFFKHLDNILQGKCFHNQQDAEILFQGFLKSQSMDFYATGINRPFLINKNVLIVMAPVLINKDMFEPSYNAFKKFTVQNHNYFCTNLILTKQLF